MWSWRNDVTSTCLISFIWVKSRRWTCLANLVVTGLMKMEISLLISDLTWTPWKKLAHRIGSPYWEVFKIRNTDLQFRSPGHVWQKNEKESTGNCKALYVSRKRSNVGERLGNVGYCKYDKCFLMQANYKI